MVCYNIIERSERRGILEAVHISCLAKCSVANQAYIVAVVAISR